MGYSEVHCQLCGTSFNIGRIRTAGEPLNTAFSFAEQGFFPAHNFVKKESIRRDECPPEAGCLNVQTTRRPKLDSSGGGKVKNDQDLWLIRDGDDENSDYIYESDEEEEALEWDENCEDSDLMDVDTEDVIDHQSNGQGMTGMWLRFSIFKCEEGHDFLARQAYRS
jgi:hypothetical protein